MNISVVGLGKLGAPLAAVLADKGHTVIGVDTNAEFVRLVNEGRPPVEEPGLREMMLSCRPRLSATQDVGAAVLGSEITFMIVPTPSGPDGTFSLNYVLKAVEPIGAALAKKNSFHLVVLTSTVMPGHTGGQVVPALEKASGKKCGRDFGLCYNPEFIALGNVIDGMLHPDFLLIGESDPRSGEMLAGLYRTVCDRNPPAARMSFVNAELTKISVNTYVTTKISYANMLAELCEKLPGADVEAVTGALGLDSRIGRKYLKGALSYGGPCFPRDNVAFARLAQSVGVQATLAEATDTINRRQAARLAGHVISRLPAGGRVAVLGLAYKPNTPVTEVSAGVALVKELAARGVAVSVYDPAAMESARRDIGGAAAYASSTQDCVRDAAVVVVTTPWDEFKALPSLELSSRIRPVVIDCWRMLSRDALAGKADYVTLGSGAAKPLA